MSLFQSGTFTLHAGGISDFKIDCDALSDEDVAALAREVCKRMSFGDVVSIPTGGDRLAAALRPYCDQNVPVLLIVDDVYTTGRSMLEAWASYQHEGIVKRGVVIFSRGDCPGWVTPLFQMVPTVDLARLTLPTLTLSNPIATGVAPCECWCHRAIGPNSGRTAQMSCEHCQVYG